VSVHARTVAGLKGHLNGHRQIASITITMTNAKSKATPTLRIGFSLHETARFRNSIIGIDRTYR
jgi:hypothetical protein